LMIRGKDLIKPMPSWMASVIISLKLSVVGLLEEVKPVSILFSFYLVARVMKTPMSSSIIGRLLVCLKYLYNAVIL
jgi:hypothetical protein